MTLALYFLRAAPLLLGALFDRPLRRDLLRGLFRRSRRMVPVVEQRAPALSWVRR
ncbi:MAG: hypothetical protein AB7M12_06670 [Hyphomonadaceae bacterium]